ncbi:MAG: type II toxin-antitoxin system RelE family toxin [Dehalococcoidia bacterium]
MFEYVFLGRARAQYDALSPDEQEDVDRAIRLLELDPWHDGITKRDLPVPPLILSVYDDGRWRLSYRVVDHRFVEIYAIGRVQRA